MQHQCLKLFIISSAFILTYVIATSGSEDTLCFRYTWLGPGYNNDSIFLNATCNDATNLASGVPCEHPLVVSYDGSWPDVDHILRNYRDNATCNLLPGYVCAKYTYYFDGRPENSTSMCTRAVDTAGTVIKSGCYESVDGVFSTKVCFCESIPGGVPCNAGNMLSLPILSSYFLIYFVIRLLHAQIT